MKHQEMEKAAEAGTSDGLQKTYSVTRVLNDNAKASRGTTENLSNEKTCGSIEIKSIIADPDLQLRAAGSDATIKDYADALADGATFPPVTVFYDGEAYHLADGFHRLEAHKLANLTEIDAEILEGDARAAKLHAASANAAHGLPRTQADKRKAILTLLTDPEWKKWSDREIGKRTHTDHKTVAKLRRELSGGGADGDFPTERKFISRHGTEGTRHVEPKQTASMIDRVLSGLPDDVLIAEVKRRGLEVTA